MILLIDDTSDKFIEIIGSWSNPILVLLFFAVVIISIIYFINRYLIKPLEEKHIQEKKEIEYKNSRMMAMFSESDPDPVIRVDADGKINFFNEAANKQLNITTGESIFNLNIDIFPQKLGAIIGDHQRESLSFKKDNIYYTVLVQGNSSLRIAQLYFRDITVIRDLELKLKQLSNYLQNQIDDERFRIASELHDGVVQDLYLFKIGLKKLGNLQSNNHMITLLDQVEKTTEELRRIIYDLKPKILDELGLEPALKSLCTNVINESGLEGSIEFIGMNGRFDKKIEINCYRMVQEALSNIIKHSGATEFGIVITKKDNLLRMIISDNGCGLKSVAGKDDKKGFGLLNMKERTEGLGGVFKIDSIENEGLTIITEIPLIQ